MRALSFLLGLVMVVLLVGQGAAGAQDQLVGPMQRRALRFQKVEKFEPNQQMRAFAGEPVIREQPLRSTTFFTSPVTVRGGEKWEFFKFPQRTVPPTFAPAPAKEELGRGAREGVESPRRPPTYIARDQAVESDFSHFEVVDGRICLRPNPPSALQQVNNRQFAPQWKF